MNGAAIASAARQLIGTPFAWGGRLAKIGIDCAGVLVLAHELAGFKVCDLESYSRRAIIHNQLVKQLAETHGAFLDTEQTGDVVLFQLTARDCYTHCGILSRCGDQPKIIHAIEGAVTSETIIPEPWKNRALFLRHRELP